MTKNETGELFLDAKEAEVLREFFKTVKAEDEGIKNAVSLEKAIKEHYASGKVNKGVTDPEQSKKKAPIADLIDAITSL